MPEDRRLAAILFTDIVGSTTLIGEDEDRTFEILRKNKAIRLQQIEKLIEKEDDLGLFSLANDIWRAYFLFNLNWNEEAIKYFEKGINDLGRAIFYLRVNYIKDSLHMLLHYGQIIFRRNPKTQDLDEYASKVIFL
jgi:hypothetical protein